MAFKSFSSLFINRETTHPHRKNNIPMPNKNRFWSNQLSQFPLDTLQIILCLFKALDPGEAGVQVQDGELGPNELVKNPFAVPGNSSDSDEFHAAHCVRHFTVNSENVCS